MQSGVAQEYVVGDHESQDDASDHTSQEDDMDEEEEVTLNETVEDEDVDVDISEAEPSSEQEAHDSGAEVLHQVEFEGYTLTESTQKTIKRTIAKKEDKELHHKASKLQPHHLPEHRYWVAILMHTMQPHKAKVEKDFVWLKGHKVSSTLPRSQQQAADRLVDQHSRDNVEQVPRGDHRGAAPDPILRQSPTVHRHTGRAGQIR